MVLSRRCEKSYDGIKISCGTLKAKARELLHKEQLLKAR